MDRIEGDIGGSSGDGGDNIVAADGIVDRISCGGGRDVVRADAEDRVAPDELVIARRGNRYVVVRR